MLFLLLVLYGVSLELINFSGSVNEWLKEYVMFCVFLGLNDSIVKVKKLVLFNLCFKFLDLLFLKNIWFLIFCIGICLYIFFFQVLYVFLFLLVIQNGQFYIEVVYVVFFVGVLEIIGSILLGIIFDLLMVKFYRFLIYNIVLFVFGILIVIILFLRVFGWFLFVCGIYGFFLGLGFVQKVMLVVDILGVEYFISFLGLFVCFQGFGVLFGFLIFGRYL